MKNQIGDFTLGLGGLTTGGILTFVSCSTADVTVWHFFKIFASVGILIIGLASFIMGAHYFITLLQKNKSPESE